MLNQQVVKKKKKGSTEFLPFLFSVCWGTDTNIKQIVKNIFCYYAAQGITAVRTVARAVKTWVNVDARSLKVHPSDYLQVDDN